MWRNIRKSPLAGMNVGWRGLVCAIDLPRAAGPGAEEGRGCRSYLILRDIFPQWALDMGLMRRKPAVFVFQGGRAPPVFGGRHHWRAVAGQPALFRRTGRQQPGRRVEVLQNWLARRRMSGAPFPWPTGPLAGRTIFVYAGNMGVAQGMGILIDLAERLQRRRISASCSSDEAAMRSCCGKTPAARGPGQRGLPWRDRAAEIPGLLAQCHVGLVALDPRHKTHNVPGKFLSYMQSGLPVLASINHGNDLADLIEMERVGRVATDHSVRHAAAPGGRTCERLARDAAMGDRCRALFGSFFPPGRCRTDHGGAGAMSLLAPVGQRIGLAAFWCCSCAFPNWRWSAISRQAPRCLYPRAHPPGGCRGRRAGRWRWCALRAGARSGAGGVQQAPGVD